MLGIAVGALSYTALVFQIRQAIIDAANDRERLTALLGALQGELLTMRGNMKTVADGLNKACADLQAIEMNCDLSDDCASQLSGLIGSICGLADQATLLLGQIQQSITYLNGVDLNAIAGFLLADLVGAYANATAAALVSAADSYIQAFNAAVDAFNNFVSSCACPCKPNPPGKLVRSSSPCQRGQVARSVGEGINRRVVCYKPAFGGGISGPRF
jgi:hypothetical protein